MPPNRWLHLRHRQGFTPEAFDRFRANCRVFRAYVEAVLENWSHFERHPAPHYEFYEPELSADRKIATLPLGGEQTLGTRNSFENIRSRMLWEWMGYGFLQDADEGLTEEGTPTHWRALSANFFPNLVIRRDQEE